MTQLRATNDSRSAADRTATLAVAVGVVLLVLIGFAASYVTLRDLAVSAGRFSPWLAPVVPLSFDLGIVVLSLKVVLAAKQGRSAIWLRLLVAGLSAATVAANASAAPTVVGRLLHAIPPAMFVICFESVTGSARRDALRAGGANVAVPPVRPILLLLAPLVTCRTWRRQVLEGQRQVPPSVTAAPTQDSMPLRERPTHTPALSQQTDDATAVNRRVVPSARGGHDAAGARFRAARSELRANPDMTAASLADVLRTQGHACSVRTAQRVKAQALLALRGGAAALADESAA